MNVFARNVDPADYGLGVVYDQPSLGMFLETECPGLIWKRAVPQDVQSWFDALSPDLLPTGRVVLPTASVAQTVTHLCDMAAMPQCDERSWFEQDINDLALAFADLTESKFLRLRLAAVANNACRKFHVDAIKTRLVCTYRGAGTQYGYAQGDHDPDPIYEVPTGSPILLRGTLMPEHPSTGLRHRSPPIEGTGETRMVLVLDPIENAEYAI